MMLHEKETVMNKCIVKKILLVSGIFLSIVNANIYGCPSGPCETGGSDCGGLGGGIGTCHWDNSIPGCTGICPSYCPSGPPDKFCVGISGDCTITMFICSSKKKYVCMELGDMNTCGCIFGGYSGNCLRQGC